ncbi:MAG TPA: hypothetical protein VHO48_08410 [Anaerolineaceae bacterium]|nr:hypothetical protein [Anaerolineaceae bacterium]
MKRWGVPAGVWACGLAFLVLILGVFPAVQRQLALASGGGRMLDLRLGYSAAQANAAVAGYGPAGRKIYATSALTADLLFPLSNAVLLGFFAGRAVPRSRWPGHLAGGLRRLPYAVAAADLLENALIVTLLLRFPQPVPLAASAAGVVTSLKWVLLGACLVTLAAGWLLQRIQQTPA